MAGYRAKRRKTRSKSFLGRSFLISLIINIFFIIAFNNLISFSILNIPDEDELIMVTMVELPTTQSPVTVRPEIKREEPIAELSTRPRIEPTMPEPARIQETETQPIVEREEALAEIASSPRAEVKMPEIEIQAREEMAPVREEVTVRPDVQVAARTLAPTITSRREVEGEVLEHGEFEIQATLGKEGRERVESTYGTTVTPGQISNLPRTIEKSLLLEIAH